VPPDIIGIKVEWKEGDWLGHVECVWHDDAHGYHKSLIIMNDHLCL